MVTSNVNYCNMLYAGLPLRILWKLQVIQNAAARLLTSPSWSTHIQLEAAALVLFVSRLG